MIGRTVAHYRVLEKLGKGGMGDVYLAEDTRLHRQVAVKVLPAATATDPEHMERFAREAKTLAGLNHPNIVTVYSVEEAGDQRLLVMELIEGRTLAEVIPSGGLTEERFFELAIPLADALSAAHARGVTHRDLKPSNIMITEDGRVKVVDFGLAKLRQEAEAREQTVLLDSGLTEEGRILGTYPYMSPEQIKGKPVDHRSDIFSLGVVLYEMATGERPFSGETSADLISSILRDDPPPTHELNRSLPRHLDRIIAHCLQRDADRRFQTAKDLRNELQSLRQELHSERLLRSTSITRRLGRRFLRDRRSRVGVAVAALVLALAAAGLFLVLAGDPGGERASTGASPEEVSGAAGAPAEAPRPSVAVLFFRNLTGDPELEWLRTGLADMLVTGLSQSPELRVLSTDRLYQILQDLDKLDEPMVSADLVHTVAERAQVGVVLLGSFARAGETLQVNVTLQDAESGEILDAQRVQGTGESSVFSIVDRLSRGVVSTFRHSGRMAAAERPEPGRGIESVTTSSVEAYQLYAEAVKFAHEFKIGEAVALLERAVALDPGFAMAYARLARIYETTGREQAVERVVDAAIAHADRLPPRERYYIEGIYYGRKRATFRRAIETLEKAVELYPDHREARYRLGILESHLELHRRAATRFETLLQQGHDTTGTYNSLAQMLEAQGHTEQARRLLEDWISTEPENWSARLVLAWHAPSWGMPHRALEALDAAADLRPGSPFADFMGWRANLLAGRPERAEELAEQLTESEESYWRWRGFVCRAVLALYRGRTGEALQHYAAAATQYGSVEPILGTGRDLAAELLLATGRPERALEETRRARQVAEGDWPAWEALSLEALAEERLGRPDRADRLAAEVDALGELLPGQVEERLHHRLLGLLAAERGNGKVAVAELERAESMLPPRGLEWHRHRLPDHVPIWYELATVHRELGDADEAEVRYRRIVESGIEHLYHPIQYVRSHYFLARLLDDRGDREGARRAYR
ncbi:MAG: protein kinase, partial [Acidobacteriota bacterium]